MIPVPLRGVHVPLQHKSTSTTHTTPVSKQTGSCGAGVATAKVARMKEMMMFKACIVNSKLVALAFRKTEGRVVRLLKACNVGY